MPVNITGGKYAARFLASVGTTNVTTTQTIFASSDFGATQRMVALFSSTGIFKGIAWVRQWISGTQLELENRFVDPITGLYAVQAVGDQVFVSKNSAESATTGFAVSAQGNLVTVTNNVLMGTAGQQNSVIFYDEHMQFSISNGFTFNGGVSVFGKLVSYDGVSKESFVWSRECTIRPNNDSYPTNGGTPAYNVWGTGGTSAHMFFFGGAVGSPMRRSFFIGAQTTGATNKSFAFYGTRLYYACASPSNGANWASDPDRHLLYKTIHEADYTNANLIVWGNGAFQGSFLSFPQSGAGTPVGVFRASTAASFGASANNRTIVADVGTGAFIDDVNNGGPYVFTNTITPSVSIIRNTSGTTVPITFQFSDDYTNLKIGTTVAVQRSDGTLVSSVVKTTSPTFTATVVTSTYAPTANGVAAPVTSFGTFNYTAKCYGYQVVNGTHSTYVYSLGTAGNGTDLKLGGLINQVTDSGVTLTEAGALALSSKFTINSTTKVITVTANGTLDELYDYAVVWNCATAANALVPSLSRYLLEYSGSQLAAPAGWSLVVNTGVTLSSGTKFSYIFSPTVTINGTGKITSVYANSTGVSTIWQFEQVEVGTSLVVYDSTGATKYFQGEVTTTGTYAMYIAPGTTGTYTYAVEKYGSRRETGTFEANAGGILFYVPDYQEDVGITQITKATVAAYTTLETNSKLYDYVAFKRLSEDFIKKGQIVTRAGTSLEWTAGVSVVIKSTATSVLSLTGSVYTIKANGLAGDSKYTTNVLIAPATMTADTTEVLTTEIEDGNGDSSITISASGISTFDIWKISDATSPDDFATGTKVATVGVGKWRFLSAPGFKFVVRDTTTNFRVVVEAEKGTYEAALYFGAAVQLAQAAEVSEINNKVDIMQIDVEAIKGTGFVKDTHSLINIKDSADFAGAISA